MNSSDDAATFHDLRQFFGSYFHQDWQLEADDVAGVVRLYVDGGGVDVRKLSAMAETLEAMVASQSDEYLMHVLESEWWSSVVPEPPHTKEFLSEVALELRKALQ